MKFIIDIIIVAIIIFSVLIGAKKGFMKIFLSVVAFLLSVYLAYSFSPIVAEFVQTKFVAPKITESISESIGTGTEKIREAIPSIVLNNADKVGVDIDSFINTASNSTTDSALEIAENFVETHVNPLMIKAISAVAAIVLFLVLSALLSLVAKIINKIIKSSPADSFNKFGGALLGAVNGLIFAAALCLIISVILNFSSDGFLIVNSENANNSLFYNFFIKLLYK